MLLSWWLIQKHEHVGQRHFSDCSLSISCSFLGSEDGIGRKSLWVVNVLIIHHEKTWLVSVEMMLVTRLKIIRWVTEQILIITAHHCLPLRTRWSLLAFKDHAVWILLLFLCRREAERWVEKNRGQKVLLRRTRRDNESSVCGCQLPVGDWTAAYREIKCNVRKLVWWFSLPALPLTFVCWKTTSTNRLVNLSLHCCDVDESAQRRNLFFLSESRLMSRSTEQIFWVKGQCCVTC